jgi:4,5-dihydroxyphthalate decarboxylase
MVLNTLLGDYPVTAALKTGQVSSKNVSFRFADVKVPNTAFKRVVRDVEFDVAELAIVTFLLAKAHGKPLRLLPAVITARFQHPLLVYNAARGPLAPENLNGKRVGQRSYSVTTAAWVRGFLAGDYGVDLDSVKWVTFEDPHVAEFRDPPNVERAPAGQDLTAMLLDGELDAAIVGEPPKDERIQPLIPDPAAAAQAWRSKFGAIQINHMVAMRSTVDRGVAQEVFELLKQSRERAGSPVMNPFGIEENRRNLEVAIDCVYDQRMIPRRFAVEELFA